MPKVEIKEGNQCLFTMFTGCNFLLFLSSLGMLSCAIYLFILLHEANVFDMAFLLVSLTLLLLTFCGFKLKRSPKMMKCFIFLQLLIFIFMLIMSLTLLLNTDKMSEWAHEKYERAKADDANIPDTLDSVIANMRAQIQAVSYAMLAFTGVLGFTIVFGWFYNESTLERTF